MEAIRAEDSDVSSFKGKTVIYMVEWEGKAYIGSSRVIADRLRHYKRYRPDSLFRVLIVCTETDRGYYEAQCVRVYDTFNTGHNQTPTGDWQGANRAWPAAIRQLIARNKQRSGQKHSEETKSKMSEAQKRARARSGKHAVVDKHSEETKQKMSVAAKAAWARKKGN